MQQGAWHWVAFAVVVALIWTAYPLGVLAAVALLFVRAWLLRHRRPLWRPLWGPLWPLAIGVAMLLHWADRYLR